MEYSYEVRYKSTNNVDCEGVSRTDDCMDKDYIYGPHEGLKVENSRFASKPRFGLFLGAMSNHPVPFERRLHILICLQLRKTKTLHLSKWLRK